MLEETRRFWNYTKLENMSIRSIHVQIMLFSLSWTYRVDVPVPNMIFFMQPWKVEQVSEARLNSLGFWWQMFCLFRLKGICVMYFLKGWLKHWGTLSLESAVSTGNYRRAFWTSLKTVGLEAKTWIHLFWMILACTCMDGSGLFL